MDRVRSTAHPHACAFPLPGAIINRPRASGSRAKNTPQPGLWESCPRLFRWFLLPPGPYVLPRLGPLRPCAARVPLGPRRGLLSFSEAVVPDGRGRPSPGRSGSHEAPTSQPGTRSQGHSAVCRGPWAAPLWVAWSCSPHHRGIWRLYAGLLLLTPSLPEPHCDVHRSLFPLFHVLSPQALGRENQPASSPLWGCEDRACEGQAQGQKLGGSSSQRSGP